MKDFYSISINDCLKELQTSKEGLSTKQAESRVLKYGENVIETKKRKNKFESFLLQFKDVMIIILLIASVISITVSIIEKSKSELIDGIIIIGIVLLNAVLGFVQENKAENALEKLKNMTKPEVKVLRDGQLVKIANNKLTLGDIVFLQAGDIVPAELRILECSNLFCDESALTGESVNVKKDVKFKIGNNTSIYDRKNILYSGTTVTNGRATCVVFAIGKNSEFGKIASIILSEVKQPTVLEKNLKSVSKIITIIVLIVATITLLLEVILRPQEPLIESFLIAVALAVASIPESLPAVVTIIMSIGVWLLAKKKVIVKKLQAVETLGACDVICADKTGTITQNLMIVKEIFSSGKVQSENFEKNEDFKKLLNIMTLCNDSTQNSNSFFGDSTETALVNFSFMNGVEKSVIDKQMKRIDEISFNSQRKLMTTLNHSDDNYFLSTKGGIDNVLNVCSKIQIDGEIVPLTDEIREKIQFANEQMANKALRVLAFCFKNISKNNLKKKELWEKNMVFVGLVGMIDPPRKEVYEAIEKCKQAGIRPVMITGDHKSTAFAIAKQVGIATELDNVLLGVDIDKMSDKELLKKVETVSVFARVSPHNKVRIVKAFESLGFVTAMTGDGVNDAPSLKVSSIGVGMGITGTDITKDVADIVIADDNFSTIVLAVEEGRKIYKNIQKAIKFLFSANLGEILAIFIATIIFPSYVFFLPIQILIINLLTDSFPAVAMAFESAESNIMKIKPRQNKNNIFSNNVGKTIIIMGILQACLVLFSFYLGLKLTSVNFYEHKDASTMAFITLNLIQLFYIFSARFDNLLLRSNLTQNKWHLLAFVFGISMLLILTLTPLREIVGFSSLNIFQWLTAVAISILIIPLAEFVKFCFLKCQAKT